MNKELLNKINKTNKQELFNLLNELDFILNLLSDDYYLSLSKKGKKIMTKFLIIL